MAFVETSYSETASTFTWIVTWDGAGSAPSISKRGQIWRTAMGIVTTPQPGGGRIVLGIDVNAIHTDGPHEEDVDPGGLGSVRLDPVGIFTAAGANSRSTDSVVHAVTEGASHYDTIHVTTQPIAGGLVKIEVLGMHTRQPVNATPTPPVTTGPTAGTPAAPPASGEPNAKPTPRKGSRKNFTVIDANEEGNAYVPLCAAFRIGEIRASSVKDMVDKILAGLDDDECIGELTIIGHGSPGSINVGNGQTGKTRGKSISVWDLAGWRNELLRLRCKFCSDSTVYLRGCNVGAGSRGARLLFLINQILQCAATVKAPTGLCNPLTVGGEDQNSDCGDTTPPATKPNPDKGKTKKAGTKKAGKAYSGRIEDGKVTMFEPQMIESGLLLPGSPDIELTQSNFDSEHVMNMPPQLISLFQTWLPSATMESGLDAGFAVDGLVQLIVNRDGKHVAVPPMAILGAGRYLAPDWQRPAALFVLPDELSDALSDLLLEMRG